jgi:hypothetical protein
MANQQKQQEKRPWPGDRQLLNAWAYHHGLSSDRSGYDAICRWAATATEEELEIQGKRAYAYGWFVGYAASYAAVSAIWKALFGDD